MTDSAINRLRALAEKMDSDDLDSRDEYDALRKWSKNQVALVALIESLVVDRWIPVRCKCGTPQMPKSDGVYIVATEDRRVMRLSYMKSCGWRELRKEEIDPAQYEDGYWDVRVLYYQSCPLPELPEEGEKL